MQANRLHLRPFALALLVICLLSALPVLAFSDLFQVPPGDGASVGVRFIRPSRNTYPDLEFLSGIFDFSASVPLSDRMSLLVEMPYMSTSVKGFDRHSAYGNPSVALRKVETLSNGTNVAIFGVALPLAEGDGFWPQSQEAWLRYSAGAANYHQIYKYAEDRLTPYFTLSMDRQHEGGLFHAIEVGAMALIYTGTGNSDTDSYLRYACSAGVRTAAYELRGGVLGVLPLNVGSEDFLSEFWHDVMFKGTILSRGFRPSVFFRLPLSQPVKNSVDSSLGVQLELEF